MEMVETKATNTLPIVSLLRPLAGTTNSAIAACMEKVSRLTTCDEKREKQFLHLMALCEEALRLPRYYQTNRRCLR